MRGFRAKAGVVVASALTVLVGPNVSTAAQIPQRTPTITGFSVTPKSLPNAGGKVTVSATLAFTKSCTISAKPKVAGLPKTFGCSGSLSKGYTLPRNRTGSPKTYQFTLVVSGGGATATRQGVATVGGAPPPITFSPPSIAFPTIAVGIPGDAVAPTVQSDPVQVTATNNSSQTQDLTGISVGGVDYGDFSVVPGSNCAGVPGAPVQISAGQSCAFSVIFAPSGEGKRRATVSLEDASWGSAGTAVVLNVGGQGSFGSVSPSSPSLSFGDQGTQTGSTNPTFLTVTNASNSVPLLIAEVQITGTDNQDFTAPNFLDGCRGSTLTPNQKCTLGVIFDPTQEGQRTATLEIVDNTTSSATQVSLSGKGVYGKATIASVDAPSAVPFNFGQVVNIGGGGCAAWTASPPTTPDYCVGEEFLLTNTGTQDLYVDGSTFTGENPQDFSFEPQGCAAAGDALAPGQSCEFGLTFYAISTGTRFATFELLDNTAQTETSVSLEGTGVTG
jgi:hypothetical protein